MQGVGFGDSGGYCLLGGSWVVISMVISPLTWVITIVTLLLTPRITTHEPPSSTTPCNGEQGQKRHSHIFAKHSTFGYTPDQPMQNLTT